MIPLVQGDEFTVLEFTTGEWYLARKLADNTEGFIPASYIAEHGSLQTFPLVGNVGNI